MDETLLGTTYQPPPLLPFLFRGLAFAIAIATVFVVIRKRRRFGLRSLFVLAAMTGLTITLWKLPERRLALWHRYQLHYVQYMSRVGTPGWISKDEQLAYTEKLIPYRNYHCRMAEKYEWAMEHWWLPVWPDPPAPPAPPTYDYPTN